MESVNTSESPKPQVQQDTVRIAVSEEAGPHLYVVIQQLHEAVVVFVTRGRGGGTPQVHGAGVKVELLDRGR